MATAYITLGVVVICYIFDHESTLNPVDRAIIDGAAKLWKYLIGNCTKPSQNGRDAIESAGRTKKQAQKWKNAIDSSVLMFSDQQLITGIGILVSGYTQITCSLSTYHWQVVVYLAWFSSLTHLTTLTALRAFFRKQPMLAYWRAFFMGCTIVLLGTALAPTGYVSQNANQKIALAVPALCLFSTAGYNEASSSLSIGEVDSSVSLEPFNSLFISTSLMFLVVSYTSRVVSLFKHTSDIAREQLRIRPGNRLKRLILLILKRSDDSKWAIFSKLWIMLAIVMTTIYVLLKVVFEIGQSMLWEVSTEVVSC